MNNLIKKFFEPKIKLVKGTRFISFLFIATSIVLAASILWAANIYYNLDTGEIVMEEVQRVTRLIKATAGLIVGGETLTNGFLFEVNGKSKLATTTLTSGQLEFSGSDTYSGFKAPASYGTSTPIIYLLPQHGISPPQENYVLTWTSGNQLKWQSVSGVGAGDITAVGDCTNGDCFTGLQGSWLKFVSGSNIGTLTIGSLSNDVSYILPPVSSGNYYFPLISQSLTPNQILLATDNYTLGGNSNLTWNPDNGALVVGSSGTMGQIRLYSNNNNYLAFRPYTNLSSQTIYTWPTPPSNTGYVLTTDSSGNLSWTLVGGIGGITGSGLPGQVAFFDGTQTITGSDYFTWSTSTNTLAINGYLTVSQTITGGIFTGPSGANTIIASASGQDILLDPDSGKIYLGSGDYIITGGGYEIGKGGTQILKEMVPIFGFDLPVKTASTDYVKISRDIVNYPLNSCLAGTSRIHKLIIRYGATVTSTWQVATSTNGGYEEFQLPPTDATSTGSVYTIETDVPTPSGVCTGWNQGTETDDWWLRVKLNDSGEIMIYQIFLGGYDQVL